MYRLRLRWHVLLALSLIISCISICNADETDEEFVMPVAPAHSEGKRISPDLHRADEVTKRVSSALDEGNVDALEKLADALLKQQLPRPHGGSPQIGYLHLAMKIYLTLQQPKEEDEITLHTFDRTLQTIHTWQQKYPRSGAAIVAEADVLLRRALAARGGDEIDKVTTGRLRVFEQSIAAAHRALTKNEEVGKTDPIWYDKMASAMWYGNADRRDFIALIDAGMRAYPQNLDLADSGITYMLPRWGGSDKEVVAYIHHVLSNVTATDAPIVAARIYYHLLDAHYYEGLELAYLLHLSPREIEQAMEERAARFPDPMNVDEEGVVACSLGDKRKLGELLAEIGESPIVVTWGYTGDGSYFSFCRNFMAFGANHDR